MSLISLRAYRHAENTVYMFLYQISCLHKFDMFRNIGIYQTWLPKTEMLEIEFEVKKI